MYIACDSLAGASHLNVMSLRLSCRYAGDDCSYCDTDFTANGDVCEVDLQALQASSMYDDDDANGDMVRPLQVRTRT